jgi:ADP-ribose pyrophosphatase YjhB (NUDIX family)
MTQFAKIDDQLLEIIHKLAKGRQIVDCGAGECLFEYKYKEKYPDSVVVSIEPNMYDNFYIDKKDIFRHDGLMFPFSNSDFPIFIRPCHSESFMPTILDKVKNICSNALYMSNPRNFDIDIPEGYTYFPIPNYVGKDDDEKLILIKLNGKKYEEQEEEWYWVKMNDFQKDYYKMRKIIRNGEPWFVNKLGGGSPVKLLNKQDYKPVQENLKYLNKMKNNIKKFETFVQDDIERGDYAAFDNDAGEAWWGNLAGGVLPICTKTKRILMNYRSKYVNEPHTWGIWGGKLDEHKGESIEDAVRREFEEESGHAVETELIPAYVFKAPSGNFQYHNFIGLVNEEFEPVMDWETENWKWITFDELMELEPKHFGLVGLLENSMDIIKKYV